MTFELSYGQKGSIQFLAPENLLEKESILIAFTTRIGGVSPSPYNTLNLAFHVGDKQENVVKNREALCKNLNLDLLSLTTAQQIHGDKVTIVDRNKVGRGAISYDDAVAETDALATKLNRVSLALFFADCVPIVLADIAKRAIAIIHSGRKGTELGIASKVVERMKSDFGSKPGDVLAFIGPAIRSCCYESDLVASNRGHLQGKGVKSSNIFDAEICTSCNTELFFSHRAEEGKTGRQTAVVGLM